MWARALDSKSGFSYFNIVDKRLGWRRLALNFTPFPQHFKLFFAVLKLKRNSHFFKDKGKFFRLILLYFWSIWLAWLQKFQYYWCDFVSPQITPNDWCVCGETGSHERHATDKYLYKRAVRLDFPCNNRHSRSCLGIIDDHSKYLSLSL